MDHTATQLRNLEYYYLYPHLETGAVLILDDIHIRTVHNLFEFLRMGAMFELDEVVQTTVFFIRTNAPTFDPFGDGWWQQKYNAGPLPRYTWTDALAPEFHTPERAHDNRISLNAL